MNALARAAVALAWRRRKLVLLTLLAAVAFSAAGARHVRFDADVLSLLPRGGRVIPAFRDYLAAFGSVDKLYVVFTAPDGHDVSEYAGEIDDWTSRLRQAPEIVDVDAGIADGSRNFSWLADRQLLLLRESSLRTALDRLGGGAMRAALADRRELLTLPSPYIADLVRQDPLALTDLAAAQIGSAVPGLNTRVATRGYVSEDGRKRLVIAQPERPPYDTEFARALDARVRGIEASVASAAAEQRLPDDDPRPALAVTSAGGYRIAIETEATVWRESILSSVGSLVLILPLLLVTFRSAWLMLVSPLPSVLALVLVLGALGTIGTTLSAAAAGSAAMLFGLGIDGVVLIYVAHQLAVERGVTAGDMSHELAGPTSSMLLGMWTTAATFYGLTFVDFPSLQQLGLLIGHSMVICGVVTMLLIPALLPRRPRPARRRLSMVGLTSWIARRRGAVLAAATILTLALGTAATQVRINPSLDRLRSVGSAAQLEQEIAGIFGLPRDISMVLSRGPDLEALLQGSERLETALSTQVPGLAIQAPSAILPSRAAQDERASLIRAAGLSAVSVGEALRQAGDATGYRPDTFQPFVNRLPALLAANERLTYEGYTSTGLADLIQRFIVRQKDGTWLTATYVFPTSAAQLAALERITAAAGADVTLTGLTLVNRELANRFLPQFLKGLMIGTAIVVGLVLLEFRRLRLTLYALLPTAVGLIWAAGLLAIARVELDLFAVFAVVTFIGVGVDYGIHLVHRYQEYGDARRAVAELAPVVLVAAAITLLGYGTLLGSSYPPLRSIGLVSIVSVVTLSVSSVVVLPAIIMGRLR